MPPRTSGLLHVGSTTVTVLGNSNYTEEEEQGEKEEKENIVDDNADDDKIIRNTTTTIRTTKDEDGHMLQANDSLWIEDYLADTFPCPTSTHSTYSSVWGIPLYSTPCQQQQSQSTRYDENHLCIV